MNLDMVRCDFGQLKMGDDGGGATPEVWLVRHQCHQANVRYGPAPYDINGVAIHCLLDGSRAYNCE